MKIDLKKYLQKRDEYLEQERIPGPVITISRQFGCDSNAIAMKLIKRINNMVATSKSWNYISKEVLDESAKELKITPERIEHRVMTHGTNPVGDIFSSISSQYGVNDTKIIKKVKEVIETYGNTGNVIIIGRGGAEICHSIKRALHVRLYAPLKWRIKNITQKRSITEDEAKELIELVDRERNTWKEHLTGKKNDSSIYHIMLNREKLSEEEIVYFITQLAENRELF